MLPGTQMHNIKYVKLKFPLLIRTILRGSDGGVDNIQYNILYWLFK